MPAWAKTIPMHPRRCLVVALGALLFLSQAWPAWADETNGGLKQEYLSVGFTQAALLNVNRNDLEAAFKALAETLGRKRGYVITSKTELFGDMSALKTALKNGTINVAIMDSWRYLSMDMGGLAAPFFVSMEQGKVGKRYVVLTRRGSGLNTLADLRGKEIVEFVATNFTMGRPWLETILLENRMGTRETFFGRTESVVKPSAAVLPVFFGRKQACVVDESGFEVMTELNPQVGKGLQTVAVSEPLLDGVLSLNNSGWSSEIYKQDVIKALGELHLEPAGQQILTLFKTDQLIPFQQKYLETARNLWARHERLRREGKP